MPPHLELITSPTYFPAIAHIRQRAFSNNLLNKCLYGQVPVDVLEAWFVERDKREAGNCSQRIIAIMDDDDTMLAYAKWEVPADRMSDIPGMMEGGGGDFGILEVPEGGDGELFAAFRKGIVGHRERYSDHLVDFALHGLGVHPEYQGRGYAGMLLRWGTEQADALKRKCYLESTTAAYGLYCRYGWVTVDEIVLGLEKLGVKEHVIPVMMREPKEVAP